ncbi:hypothetical protein [Devosia chinhatensis]|uniref:Uncharacterized protein n=1 Tax=Devosia chinhatensis TaxID=429727 RepID=A0A0F5FGG4_9HYPH|nr:hypothetical protein [Devosia chinhatensis]KKB07994.1 hypothetical protein VE26_15485 [Devosia chinhatensis]
MHRLVALIALIFAFASLAGTTTAHAHRYVSTPIVVLNHVDENNVAIPVVVQIQRGEIDLGSGIVMPCGPHQAIPVTAPLLPLAPECDAPIPQAHATDQRWSNPLPLRPPISS